MAWIDFIGHPIGLDGHPLGLDVWYYVYFCTMVSFIGMSALMSLFGQYSAFSIFHDAESGTNKFETRRLSPIASISMMDLDLFLFRLVLAGWFPLPLYIDSV